MAFDIIRNDITKVKADAIVNTANPRPFVGSGTDTAIYRAAGEKRLLAARQKIGDIAPGQAFHTSAFRLPAKYIIHTVGPVWVDGSHGERETLRACYANSLALADRLRCKSVAFPLLSAGSNGFPKDEALHIALSEIGAFLLTHEMRIILVVFDREAFALSADLVNGIEEFIDDSTARSLAQQNRTGVTQCSPGRQRENFGRCYSRFDADVPTIQHTTVASSEIADRREPPVTLPFAPSSDGASRKDPAFPYISDAFSIFDSPSEDAGSSAKEENVPMFSSPLEDREEAAAPTAEHLPPPDAPAPPVQAHQSSPQAEKCEARRSFRPAPPVAMSVRKSRDAKGKASRDATKRDLDEILKGAGETFQQKLFELIDASGMDDVTVYKKANIDRKVFSRIRCKEDYRPTKKTAVAFAIALELDMPTTQDLLARAEIAISPSSTFDLIVTYFITHRIYDIFEINAVLFQYDQPLLGQ